jgi:hypothetical protein
MDRIDLHYPAAVRAPRGLLRVLRAVFSTVLSLIPAARATKQNAGDAKIDPAMALFDAVTVMIHNPEARDASSTDPLFWTSFNPRKEIQITFRPLAISRSPLRSPQSLSPRLDTADRLVAGVDTRRLTAWQT